MFPENKLDAKITPHEKICNSHFKMPALAQSNDRKNTVGTDMLWQEHVLKSSAFSFMYNLSIK